MQKILWSIRQGNLDFTATDKEEMKATKALRDELASMLDEFEGDLDARQKEQLEHILDKDSEIYDILDEIRFIRYATFGARLTGELIGGISKDGNTPVFSSLGEKGVVSGLYELNVSFEETIQSNSERYDQANVYVRIKVTHRAPKS